jgi:transcriptional regulator with XRE-family HTH domain
VTTESFGARLRHERERRGIAISSIADRTKIAPHLLTALERGDLTRWPGGLYRRAFIRAYAESVGLDPNEVLEELRECCPDSAETAPGTAAPIPPLPGAATAAPASAMVRLRIDPAPQVCRGGPVLSDARHRIAAIAADLAILGVISVGFAAALDEFWMPLAVAMAGYYAGGILIFGNTPGVCLAAAMAAEDPAHTEASNASGS